MRKFIPLLVIVAAALIYVGWFTVPKTSSAVSFVPGDIATITSDIIQDKISVTPSAEVEKTYTEVRQLYVQARESIAVRVAFDDATTSDTSESYWVIPSGGNLTLKNLYLASVTLKVKGNTASDTGNVAVIIGK